MAVSFQKSASFCLSNIAHFRTALQEEGRQIRKVGQDYAEAESRIDPRKPGFERENGSERGRRGQSVSGDASDFIPAMRPHCLSVHGHAARSDGLPRVRRIATCARRTY